MCYDLRFPVFSRRRPELDYELLLYVANWPAARAMPGGSCCQRAPSRTRPTSSASTGSVWTGRASPYAGDSAAIDFLGRTLLQAGDRRACSTVELPARRRSQAFREKFPAHLDADRFTLSD